MENRRQFGFIVTVLLKNLLVFIPLVQDKYSEVEMMAWL